jgi:hypothetical protein
MRPNHLAVWVILLAAVAAPGQTPPGEGLPKTPGPVLLPPPPASAPQPAPLPSVSMPPPLQPARPEPAPVMEEKLSLFDPQRLEVVRDDNGWELMVDGTVLKGFGIRETDARMALRLLREFGLNQHGAIGGPAPVMEYWLHDGKPPHGLTNGLQVYQLDADTLRVEQVTDHWCLRDGQRMLFDFGTSSADAQQALAVIRKHGFTQIGALAGQGGPVMLVFFGKGVSVPVAAPPVPGVPPPHPHDVPVRPVGFERQAPPPPLPPIPAITGATPLVPTNPAPVITTSADANPVAERTPVDWRQTQIEKDGDEWKLVSASHELAKFGSEREAHLALSALLYYHFTEREQVGSPKAHFAYYLADGQLPRGAILGVPCDLFQPDRLRVAEVGGRWTISNGERVLLSFGDKQDEARHVLDVIQHNKCDRLYKIGMGDDYGLTFLARSR